MLSQDPFLWAAFAYIIVSAIHLPSPINALNGLAILFLPIYAQKLRIPEKHPKKVIGYYVLYLQLSWININPALDSFLVVTLYWQTRRSLRLSKNTDALDQKQTTLSENDANGKSTTQNEGSSSIQIPEPTSTPQLDPTKFQLPIKPGPFIFAAGLTILGFILALVDSYYSNYNSSFPRDSRMYRQDWTSYYHIRGLMSQVCFSLVLMAVQAYVMLPPGSFQRAYTSLMTSFRKLTVVVYMTFPNAAIYSLTLLTINTTPYRYMKLLWDMFFWTGPHFAFILALIWHLYHTCLMFERSSSSTTINGASKEHGLQEVHVMQNHDIDLTDSSAIAATEKDTKIENKHDTVLALEREDLGVEQQGIDISELSAPSTFMVHIPDIEDYEDYELLQDR